MTNAVEYLLAKGVRVINPESVEIADDVDLNKISSDGVTIYGGCRIRGASTVLSAGVELGSEGPVTLENCQLGPNVQLKGGYAAKAVFLDGASLGLGHHVREGSILEEEANGAHNVGLKQTILFPFVTLGSLINFCDVLMAGGTSRSDHSEVGSSYIHFNFTPTGDKATASRYGDVPRGVFLRQRPIFLGGQGGSVGPVIVNYGNVVGAGSVLRDDLPQENMLTVVAPPGDIQRPFSADNYRKLWLVVAKNLAYLAHLDALEQWYRNVRSLFFAQQEFGDLILDGALAALRSGRAERISRLKKMAAKITAPEHVAFVEKVEAVCAIFGTGQWQAPNTLLDELGVAASANESYLGAITALSDEHVAAGTAWMQSIVREQLSAARALLPQLPTDIS